MTILLSRIARLAVTALALAGAAALTGCIDSAAPILTDAKPLFGEHLHLQLYGVHDGAAHEPAAEVFAWRGDRYVRTGGSTDIGDFSPHAFEGDDLIVQNMQSGKPVEYALARKSADGVYLVFPIDETDSDEPTRSALCAKDARTACRVTTRDQIFALARATAAKPHSTGGLAIVMAQR